VAVRRIGYDRHTGALVNGEIPDTAIDIGLWDKWVIFSMITLASWYEPGNWRGRLMRISYTAGRQKGLRKSVYDWGVISCLIPTWDLVKAFRTGQVAQDEYVRTYLELLRQRWEVVDEWLHSLVPEEDLTLLCHEREGEFCHRQLVSPLVTEHRPDIDVVLR